MGKDNEGTWLVTLFWVVFSTVVSILITKSVMKEKLEDAEREIKELKTVEECPKDTYWLIDESHCLHQTDCFRLKYDDYGLHQVEFVKENNFKGSSFYRYCPSCITTDDYEYVQKVLSQ